MTALPAASVPRVGEGERRACDAVESATAVGWRGEEGCDERGGTGNRHLFFLIEKPCERTNALTEVVKMILCKFSIPKPQERAGGMDCELECLSRYALVSCQLVLYYNIVYTSMDPWSMHGSTTTTELNFTTRPSPSVAYKPTVIPLHCRFLS